MSAATVPPVGVAELARRLAPALLAVLLLVWSTALRAHGVDEDDQAFIEGAAGVNIIRYNGMIKDQPFKFTTISGSYSVYRMNGTRPKASPLRDNVSYWIASGRPTWDPVAQEERWRVHFATIENGGTLATAGNLVFHGTQEGVFAAHDAETGEVLWQTELLPTMGSPITYELDGKQYVAVMSGTENDNPPGRVYTFALK